MSLQSLIDLRTSSRLAPASVWLIVGTPPRWIEDAPSVVVIRKNQKSLDLRALVGLNVDLIQIEDDTETLHRAMDALEAAKPKVVGFVGACGAVASSDAHRECLEKARRLFCN